MNLFTVSVEDFSQEMDGLKLYKRTFIGGQFALTVSAFGFLSWNEDCSCISGSHILNPLSLVFAISILVTF